MKILYRYLYKKLTIYLLIIIPSFSIVAILVELIELLRKAKNLDFSAIALYTLYQLPEKIYYILPISVVIAFFLLAKDLINRREIYPILLNGISLKKLGTIIFIFPVLLSFVQLANLEFVMPKAKMKAQEVYLFLKNRPQNEPLIAYNSWVTIDKRTFMYFGFLDLRKKVGKNIVIIKFNKDFDPVLRIEGSNFNVEEKVKIKNAKIIDLKSFTDFTIKKFPEYSYDKKLDLNSFKKLIKIKKPVSIRQYYKVAKIAEKFGHPASLYWSKFYSKLATVVSPFILGFVVYPLLWSRKKYVIGVIAGLIVVYWYATAFLTSIASTNVIPFYAIFSVDIVYLVIGALLFKKLKFSEL
ncbi:LptF/LptG family permease [Persephonella sp.]|uniref:LptF/LptG family permease n=1 Tax=Persephonella sp. TaxID=2060922 RepID=UPI0026339F40|nr:LptF/LptG family permease [Persephonella sp.]